MREVRVGLYRHGYGGGGGRAQQGDGASGVGTRASAESYVRLLLDRRRRRELPPWKASKSSQAVNSHIYASSCRTLASVF